jgi:acetyltransferase-like isoleucine patch superfamily enzyme
MLMGVEIGKESIVAAGSLVKESFGDRILIAGNPAVLKKQILK